MNFSQMDDCDVVRAGASEKLYCRRSREMNSDKLQAIWIELMRRDPTGKLWDEVLSGVLREEAAIRRSNEQATEALRAMHREGP